MIKTVNKIPLFLYKYDDYDDTNDDKESQSSADVYCGSKTKLNKNTKSKKVKWSFVMSGMYKLAFSFLHKITV